MSGLPSKNGSRFSPTVWPKAVRWAFVLVACALLGVVFSYYWRVFYGLDARGIPCAITSSSPGQRLERYLTSLNLYHRFKKVISGYDVPRGKPEPDIYLRGAEELGFSPEVCLALEDSPAGILSAYRAGCLPVLIPDLDTPGTDTLSLLYAKADSLEDVITLL